VMRGQSHADSLFGLYKEALERFEVPVYNAIGNHELFGIYDDERPVDPSSPDYKWGMFERHMGDSYYSFDRNGWHFIMLNSIDSRGDGRYIGWIDEEQIAWLREDLAAVPPTTPVAVVTHIPFHSVQRQIYPPAEPQLEGPSIGNGAEVLELLEQHNLRLVLQAHLHWTEDIYVKDTDTRFITGGAVAGRPSWSGFRHGAPGFIVVTVRDDEVSWRFVDYGWQQLVEEHWPPADGND